MKASEQRIIEYAAVMMKAVNDAEDLVELLAYIRAAKVLIETLEAIKKAPQD